MKTQGCPKIGFSVFGVFGVCSAIGPSFGLFQLGFPVLPGKVKSKAWCGMWHAPKAYLFPKTKEPRSKPGLLVISVFQASFA
jgi:hypothetical protein